MAWCAGLALVVGLLIASPLVLLWMRRTEIAALQQEIDGKESALWSHPPSPEYSASLQEMQVALAGWRTVAESEALRLAELSSAARASGATLAGIQTLEVQRALDGRIVSCPCRLSLRGRYDQLASFCNALYAARGLAAIEELEIEPHESGETDTLQASMQVAWYAPGPASAGEEQGTLP
jgi:hypothetical protein